jgi:RNA exonuclease 1
LSGKPRQTAIVEYGTPERGFGREATYKIACEDDDEIVQGVLRAARGDPLKTTSNGDPSDSPPTNETDHIPPGGVDFIWARLRDLEAARGWNTAPPPLPTNPTPSDLALPNIDTDTESKSQPTSPLQTTATQTLQRLKTLFHALPPKTLLIAYSGTSDMQPYLRLQQLQALYRREFKVKKWDELSVKWTDTEEQALRKAMEGARRGVGIIAVR